MPGTVYLVATPLGNLGDITERAIETLKRVSFIACEDTRHSRVLLEKIGVKTPCVSLPAFAEGERAGRILDRVEAGEDCALITDAGSPAVSDPGEKLVAEAVERKIPVSPIPGPSAVIAALSVSGLPTARFNFVGFLPRKGPDRASLLEEASRASATQIFYESPRRLAETLEDLVPLFGGRRACVARELTKLHEELVRGTVSELAERYRGQEVLGEVVLLVEGKTGEARWTEDEVRKALRDGLARGERVKGLSTEVAKASGWSGQDVYRLALAEKG